MAAAARKVAKREKNERRAESQRKRRRVLGRVMEELRSLREIARQARTEFGSASALRRIRCVFKNRSKEVCR